MSKLDNIQSDLASIEEHLSQFVNSLEFDGNAIDDFRKQIPTLNDKIKTIAAVEGELSNLKKEHCLLKLEMNNLQQYSRRENIEIMGVSEKNNENIVAKTYNQGGHGKNSSRQLKYKSVTDKLDINL